MRYKGTNNSTEINKSYERMIKKITKLSLLLDEYDDFKKSRDMLVTIDKDHAYKYIDKLQKSKSSITCSDMTAISGAFIDTNSMYVSDDIVSIKDIKMYDKDLIIDDIFIDVFDDGVYTSSDINIYGMFSDIPYIREIKTPLNIKSVKTTIIISIPSSVNPSTIANMLKLKTFPFHSCYVENVDYSNIYDNRNFTSIDELKNHKGCIINTNNLNASGTGSISLAFPTKDIKKIAITLSQDTPSSSDDTYNVFHVGMSNLSLSNVVFDSQERVIDILYKHDFEPVYIEGVMPIFSGIMHDDCQVSVYKVVGDELELVMDEFEPFLTDFEDIVFRLKVPRSFELMILKEFKIISK